MRCQHRHRSQHATRNPRHTSVVSRACRRKVVRVEAARRCLAIVTGGSRGLGYHIAQHWLRSEGEGTDGDGSVCRDLVILARCPERVETACQRLQASMQRENTVVHGHAVDMGDMQQLRALLARICLGRDQGGWLPQPPEMYSSVLLVNNAGTTGQLRYSWGQTLDTIEREMQVNVVAPAALTAAVVGCFRLSVTCQLVTVVNISSVSATQPYECFGVYSAGKAARLLLTSTLAREADLVHNPAVLAATRRDGSHHHHHQPDSQPPATAATNHDRQGTPPVGDPPQSAEPGNTTSTHLPPGTGETADNHTRHDTDRMTEGSTTTQGHHTGSATSTPCSGPPIIRSLSYAPGALDTDMQTQARESLPTDAPLKAAFEANWRQKRLVDPNMSARYLIELLQGRRGPWDNGAHLSVYDLMAAEAAQQTNRQGNGHGNGHREVVAVVAHPLDYNATGAGSASMSVDNS